MYPNVGPASSLGKDLAPVASWHGCKSRREGLNGPNRIQSVRSFLRSSLWAVPFIAIPLTMAVTRLLHWLDAQLGWTLLGFGVAGAQAVLQAIVRATLSFLVFTFGPLLVAVQVASGQLIDYCNDVVEKQHRQIHSWAVCFHATACFERRGSD